MTFHAAKDLVYTINGNNISSGGYRISKILNGKSKKKGKHAETQGGGGPNIFNEDSGIPVGLLLLQRLHFETEHRNHGNEDKNKNANDFHTTKIDSGSNKKLVYASIIENNDNDESKSGENIELVIMPSSSGIGLTHEGACYSENSTEICSNEIDDDLYDSFIKSVSQSGSQPNAITMVKEMAPLLRKTNTTKKQHFGKHKDIERVFQKRRTKSKRRRD